MKLTLTAAIALLLCLPLAAAAQQPDMVGQAVTITLSNGSKITGTVVSRQGGKVTLKADLIGEIVIEEKDVAGFGPAATAAPTQVTPSAVVAPAVKWTTTGTFGYTYVSGPAPALNIGATHGTSTTVFTERASPKDAVSLTGTYTYQRTKPADAAANNGSLTLAYNRPFKKVYTFISRTQYAKDDVQKVTRRVTNLNGVGFIPVYNRRVSLSLVPGIGFTSTDYDVNPLLAPLFAGVKNDALGYGGFEYLKVNLMPTLSINQTFLHVHSFTTKSQYVSQSMVSLVGLVSRNVGLSIVFSTNYDSQLPEPYIKKMTNTLTSGVQFKF